MRTTATVEGMHCAACASGIERFLQSQAAINAAAVDYDTKQLSIEHYNSLNLSTLWDHITKMGYEVDPELTD